MKRKVILLVVLALILTSVCGFAGMNSYSVMAAPEFQRVDFISAMITATNLNVRTRPAMDAPIVCVLKKNQMVKVFGKMGDWLAVYEPTTRCVGLASSKYIQAVGTAPQPTPSPAQISQLPSTNAPSIQSPANIAASGISQDEQKLLSLCNAERKKAGAGMLEFDTNLLKVARVKAKDMVDNNYFSHQSPTYGSPFDMMKQFGIQFRAAGENIAGNRSVEGAFNAWMNSEGHRKNILNGDFTNAGFGIVSSPTYGKVLVQEFIRK